MSEGTVISRYKKNALIKSTQGNEFSCVFKNKNISPLVGDKVFFSEENNTFIIKNILPRLSEFTRIDKNGKKEAIASNITQLAIVIAPKPKPDWFLLDKYLCTSQIKKFKTFIIFNKTDLGDLYNERLRVYKDIGYKIIYTNNKFNNDRVEILNELSGQTSVFIGQSGVGKSSIINKLVQKKTQLVGKLSEKLDAGKHTTTTSTLFTLPNKAMIIDSPGVRNYAPYFENASDILNSFVEFKKLKDKCHFSNCKHISEPNCSVKKALKNDLINKKRYESFLKIYTLLEKINSSQY